MMSIKLETWRKLYSAAIKLDQLSSWKRIYGYNIFALENFQKEEPGFCTFSGKQGAFRNFFVYQGLEGLAGYTELMNYDGKYSTHRFYQQQGLQLVYLNRPDLDKTQLSIIKKLGLHFSGAHNWPVFFKFEAEILPQSLNSEEDAEDFIRALELAIEVSLHLEKYESKLKAKDEQYLMFTRNSNGKLPQWRSKRTDLSNAFHKTPFSPPLFNQIKLELLAQTLPQSDDSWIADYMLAPVPVVEKELNDSPFFMRAYLIVDENSQRMLHHKLYHKQAFRDGISNDFLNAIEEIGSFPEAITVINVDTWHYLNPLAERLGIELLFESENSFFDELFSSMPDLYQKEPTEKKGKE